MQRITLRGDAADCCPSDVPQVVSSIPYIATGQLHTCHDHDAASSCRWQAEEDPTYALFEAALQGSSYKPTVTSARDAKLEKAKGRVGFTHGQHCEAKTCCIDATCWKQATAHATQMTNTRLSVLYTSMLSLCI